MIVIGLKAVTILSFYFLHTSWRWLNLKPKHVADFLLSKYIVVTGGEKYWFCYRYFSQFHGMHLCFLLLILRYFILPSHQFIHSPLDPQYTRTYSSWLYKSRLMNNKCVTNSTECYSTLVLHSSVTIVPGATVCMKVESGARFPAE